MRNEAGLQAPTKDTGGAALDEGTSHPEQTGPGGQNGASATGSQPLEQQAGAPATAPASLAGKGGGATPPATAPAPTIDSPADGADPPARTLKLILTLRPLTDATAPEQGTLNAQTDESGQSARSFSALLAVGAEGCDPVFRTVESASLAAIAEQLPALIADAQLRWQTQPRYPRATPPSKPAGAPKGASADSPPARHRTRAGRGQAAAEAAAANAATEAEAKPPMPTGPLAAIEAPAPERVQPAQPTGPTGPAGSAGSAGSAGPAATLPAKPASESETTSAAAPASPEASPADAHQGDGGAGPVGATSTAQDRPATATKRVPSGQLSLFG